MFASRTLMLLPLLALTASPALDAKDGHKHKDKIKKETSREWRNDDKDGDLRRRTSESRRGRSEEGWRNRSESEDERRRESWTDPMIPRETRGHIPHDTNGDGVVSRHEWPGNDQSWRNQDRNGDGVINDIDRQITPRSVRKAPRNR